MSEFAHPQLLPWGYTVDAEKIPDFLTDTEFFAYTAGKFSGDTRVAANIPSATESIRNFCGWHISPSLVCGMLYRVQDLRDAFVGSDLLVQLPANYVTSVHKIVLDAVLNPSTNEYEGELATDFEIGMGDGLLRIYDVGARSRKSKIFIKFEAGYPENMIQTIKELTADLVTHAVANSYGVNSESAGGVSVSYSSAWTAQVGSTGLSNNTRSVLGPYKVKGVL